MIDYRFYFLSADGGIRRAEDVPAATDEAAVRLASDYDHPSLIEIWCRQRLVGTVDPKTQAFARGESGAPNSKRSSSSAA